MPDEEKTPTEPTNVEPTPALDAPQPPVEGVEPSHEESVTTDSEDQARADGEAAVSHENVAHIVTEEDAAANDGELKAGEVVGIPTGGLTEEQRLSIATEFEVVSDIIHNGLEFHKGDLVTLDVATAETLLAAGAIK